MRDSLETNHFLEGADDDDDDDEGTELGIAVLEGADVGISEG